MTTPRLALPEIVASQAQKEVTHNDALWQLDILVQPSVLDKDLTTPPGSPTAGDAYIVAATATGSWTGKEKNIAHYVSGQWVFYAPVEGMVAEVADENLFYWYNGSAWAIVGASLVAYSNGSSGLTANDVQAAIDEVEGRIDTLEAATVTAASVTYSNATSGLMATNVQAAIDEVEGRVDTAEAVNSSQGVNIATLETRTNDPDDGFLITKQLQVGPSTDTYIETIQVYRTGIKRGIIDQNAGNIRIKATNANSVQIHDDANLGIEVKDGGDVDFSGSIELGPQTDTFVQMAKFYRSGTLLGCIDNNGSNIRLRALNGNNVEIHDDASLGLEVLEGGDVTCDRNLTVAQVMKLGSYTVAGTPAASSWPGGMIYVSNGAAGSPVAAFSNGTNWLRCDTLGVISAT